MTPLHEQLRNAADDCTPSPLKDLLNRAADAVDVKQEPVATVKDLMLSKFNPLVYERGFDMNAPLYTHPAQIPDGMMLVPVEPTAKMWLSGMDETRHEENGEIMLLSGEQTCRIYKAMLKATGEPNDNAK